MGNQTRRFLIPAHGPQVEPIAIAIKLAEELSEQTPGTKDVILFVPTKQNVEGTKLESAIGSRPAKALLKGQTVGLGKNAQVRLETKRKISTYQSPDIVIVVYADKEMLDKADDMRGASEVIVVPWLESEVEEWKNTWNPIIPGQNPAPAKKKIINNPVVEEAMKSLTLCVNLSTGITHSADKGAAVEMFRILKRNNEHYDPDELKAWALRNGWTARGANDLREVAQGIKMGKRLRGGKGSWPGQKIKIWRKQAKEQK